MRAAPLVLLLLAGTSLGACSTWKPPEIRYDDTPKQAVLAPDPPKPVEIVQLPQPLPLPGQLKPIPGGRTAPPEAADPRVRVATSMRSRSIRSRTARSTNSMPPPAKSPT